GRMGPVEQRRIVAGFYRRDTLEVARDLLGRMLCRRLPGGSVLRGRLVEVEAYDGPRDRASHAWPGPTARNAPMFGPGGFAYVYLVYGMHHCLNVVTGPRDYPAAVLLRAAESPEVGVSASGPGRLTRAFRVDRALDGASLSGPHLWLERGAPPSDNEIGRTARIGVDYAGGWARRRLRFVIRGHPDLSGPAALNRSGR
ncbi:MAG: DNA-3-methyladenine glycosylase, partial [Acidobacteriota bacterium]|nr:DNA-3-methyladenine glycosylase [Acidobacteriota bacterium]